MQILKEKSFNHKDLLPALFSKQMVLLEHGDQVRIPPVPVPYLRKRDGGLGCTIVLFVETLTTF